MKTTEVWGGIADRAHIVSASWKSSDLISMSEKQSRPLKCNQTNWVFLHPRIWSNHWWEEPLDTLAALLVEVETECLYLVKISLFEKHGQHTPPSSAPFSFYVLDTSTTVLVALGTQKSLYTTKSCRISGEDTWIEQFEGLFYSTCIEYYYRNINFSISMAYSQNVRSA